MLKAAKISLIGGFCPTNHDNVLTTGLSGGTIRGFTTLNNTMNQTDPEALDLCVHNVRFGFWDNLR